jgi:uncharacterized membrane protein (DUF373 family)
VAHCGGYAVTDSESPLPAIDGAATIMDRFVNLVELAAAALFALLFGVGVVDLSIIIVEATLAGNITDPQVVIGLIDVGLLLLIIVEVYQTVVAYIRESDTRRIVRLVIYTGVIAVVRKVIIYRTSEYQSVEQALLVAVSYAVLTLGLVALLYVERRTSEGS